MPTISVVLPTYNRAQLLGRSIRSVLNQTWRDFEIIVVDDGSADRTEDVVEGFHDTRIQYVRHAENRGEAAARNTGIAIAQGDYIASQDSDDEWLPEKLEKQLEIFESAPPDVGVVYTGFLRVKDNTSMYIPPPTVTRREGDIHEELLAGNFVGTPTTLVRKTLFQEAGMFDERLPHLVDWEMWLRLAKFCRFRCVDEPLVIVRFTPGSISADQGALVRAYELILEKHSQDFVRNKRLLARHQFSVGNLLCQAGEMNRGRCYFLKAVAVYPVNVKYPIAAFVSLLGRTAYTRAARLKHRIH